jgi:hypothetical protein
MNIQQEINSFSAQTKREIPFFSKIVQCARFAKGKEKNTNEQLRVTLEMAKFQLSNKKLGVGEVVEIINNV